MLAKIRTNIHLPKLVSALYLERAFFHAHQDFDKESPSLDWDRAADYGKLIRLTLLLRTIEQIDGRTMNSIDSSVITDQHILHRMQTFNSLAKKFIGETKPRTMTLNSLTKVCDLLSITAQQRKTVRLAVCPQVTQHHIWKGALEDVLHDLKHEIDIHSPNLQMGHQILCSCLKFFSDAALSDAESPSWMKPAPLRKVEKVSPPRMWEEVLEMFVDLTKCLETEERLVHQISKIEVMKEGLYQIRDIAIERDATYKEVKRQDCLVQRNLSKNLGHSSKCLFTLLLYYLYGSVKDIEVEVCRGFRASNDRPCVHVGKILTSCDEGMVMNGVKQLSRALGVFKFVWESAGMSRVLELHGHLWCIGAEERRISYRGNVFYLHGIKI